MPMKKPEQKKGGNQPQKHASKLRIISNLRRRKLIEAALDGKPLRKVGLEMGLSPKTVDSQISRIMKEPQVQQTFARILEDAGISDNFLAAKLRSLIDAKTVLFFQHQGQVIAQQEVPALETQRKVTELVCRLKGHLKEKTEVDINVGLMQMVVAAMNSQ